MKKSITIGILVFLLSLSLVIAQRSPLSYPLSVQNPGGSLERYQFTLDEFGEYATFDENPLLVGAGQAKIVTLTLDVPCTFSGTKNLTLTILSQIQGGSTKIILPLSLASCSPLDAEFGDSFSIGKEKETRFIAHAGPYSICEDSKEAIPLFLHQSWPQEMDYRLTLQGEAWASLIGAQITLQPAQKGLVYVRLQPSLDREGNYSFVLNARSSGKNYPFPFNVTVRNCFGVAADVPEEIRFCGCERKAFDVNITNIGAAAEKIGLVLNGESWATLEPSEMVLGAGDSDAAFLKLEPPCEEDSMYEFELETSLVDKPEVKEVSPFEVQVLTDESCFRTELVAEKAHEIDYENASLPVVLRNAGGKTLTYTLDLQGAPWVSLPQRSATVAAGANYTVELKIAPSPSVPAGKYYFMLSATTGNRTFEQPLVLDLAKETDLRGFAGWLWWNRYYVYTGIGLAAVLVLLVFWIRRTLKKSMQRARRRAARRSLHAGKNISFTAGTKKRKRRAYLFFLTLAAAVVLVLLADALSLFERGRDFFVVYSNFILLGIALAVVLIVFLRYYRQIIDFLKEKDNEKRR